MSHNILTDEEEYLIDEHMPLSARLTDAQRLKLAHMIRIAKLNELERVSDLVTGLAYQHTEGSKMREELIKLDDEIMKAYK